ncbi:MAG: hypothetical protein H7A46_26755 [Verrucomicrobiales bacterium]|nr:hypothetical protein [Verrucomicrobiales bacterium]
MKLQYIVVAIAVVVLSGCAVVDVTKTSKGFYDKTNANEIEILKTRPERSYEELGTVTASGFAATDTAKMHNAIRTKSAALGANAVILTEEGMLPDGWGSGRKWATGVAIRYK